MSFFLSTLSQRREWAWCSSRIVWVWVVEGRPFWSFRSGGGAINEKFLPQIIILAGCRRRTCRGWLRTQLKIGLLIFFPLCFFGWVGCWQISGSGRGCMRRGVGVAPNDVAGRCQLLDEKTIRFVSFYFENWIYFSTTMCTSTISGNFDWRIFRLAWLCWSVHVIPILRANDQFFVLHR
jgi:hypothetical protein